MNRQPIDLDDPRLTDFLLSEMPLNESKKFQQQLSQSPLAQREMDAMDDVMSLLTEGLKSEWSDRPGTPVSLELVAAPAEENATEDEHVVVEMHNFGKTAPSRAKMLSLAAVLTGMLVVGSLVLNQRDNTGRNYAETSPAVAVEALSSGDVSVDRNLGNSVAVPALLLSGEVKDFDLLVAELESPVIPIDDSYLGDAPQMIKASYSGDSHSLASYLPLEARDSISVDLQLGDVRSEIVSDAAGKGRMKTYTRSGSWSGSGRLGLISNYGGMQADLVNVLEAMENNEGALSATQAAQIKEQLRSIIEQSRKIGGQLAH